MRLVRFADLAPMRWKNGGGETRELAIHPPGAALDGFDWRISMARVAVDGPFSAFPEVDRTLVMLDGAGFDLAVEFAAPLRLTSFSEPYAFPADVATVATLVDGPVDDLNVMTRRGRFEHEVTARDLAGPIKVEAAGGTLIVVCGAGEVSAGDAVLGRRDALVLDGDDRLTIEPHGEGARILLVAIRTA